MKNKPTPKTQQHGKFTECLLCKESYFYTEDHTCTNTQPEEEDQGFIPDPCKKEGCDKLQWNTLDSELCKAHTMAHYYPDKYDEDGTKTQPEQISTDELIRQLRVDGDSTVNRTAADRLASQQQKIIDVEADTGLEVWKGVQLQKHINFLERTIEDLGFPVPTFIELDKS